MMFPEILLALTLIGLILSEVSYFGERLRFVTGISVAGLGAAFLQTLLTYQLSPTLLMDGSLAFDGLSVFFKLFFIFLALLTVIFAIDSPEISHSRRTEYYAFLVGACLSMCLAASATNLLIIFLSLQLLN